MSGEEHEKDASGTGGYQFSPSGVHPKPDDTQALRVPGKGPVRLGKETRRKDTKEGPRVSKSVRKEIVEKSDEEDSLRKSGTTYVREDRISCSFPGMMKVLVPEKSFVPIPLAVRVVNISTGGAMIEVHDSVKMSKDQPLTNRFFELKVAHPDVPELRGVIAWSDFGSEKPRLGLSCFERRHELAEIVQASETSINWEGPPPLPIPELDPFSPNSKEDIITISGKAEEALEIIVKRDERKYAAPVKNGRFKIRLDLEPGGENQFSLRSIAGQRRSRSIPVRVFCEKGVMGKVFFFDVKEVKKENKSEALSLEFTGTVRQSERVLYRLSQLMAFADRVTLDMEVTSLSGFDARLVETLKAEGAVLASDTRNEIASKLLEDLM